MNADVAAVWTVLTGDDTGHGATTAALASLDRLAAAVEAAREVARQLRATRHADHFYVSDRALDTLDDALAAVAPPLDHSRATDVDSRA